MLAEPYRVDGDPVQHGVIVEQGIQRCRQCGVPHDCRRIDPENSVKGVTWSDPTDGHSYRCESWEKAARAYHDEYGPLPPLPPQ